MALYKLFQWSGKRRERIPARDDVYLVGERVALREKRRDDLRTDYSWRTDRELAELDASHPLTMPFEEYETYALEDMKNPGDHSKRLSVDTVEGRHIGNVMFYDIDLRQGRAELGIMIGDKEYWSQGYGTETVGLLLDHMFGEYPFDLIYLHTLTWNHRAQKSFHKAGFKSIAQVRRNGYDFIRMEIWRNEWERMREREEAANANGASPVVDTPGGR